MSTKKTIFDLPDNSFEVFEDSSEPHFVDGAYAGDNLYLVYDPPVIISIMASETNLFIQAKCLWDLVIPLSDLIGWRFNIFGFVVVIKGGSETAKRLTSKDFKFNHA